MVSEFDLKQLSILRNSLPYFNLRFDKNLKTIDFFFASSSFVNKRNNILCNPFSVQYAKRYFRSNNVYSESTQRSFYSLKIFYAIYIVLSCSGNMCFSGYIIFIKINYKFLLKKKIKKKILLLL